MDGIVDGTPLGDHSDPIAKFDQAPRSLLLVIVDSDATSPERMTMRKDEAHCRHLNALALSHPHHHFALGAATFEICNGFTDLRERKNTVDHGLEFLLLDKLRQLREFGAAGVHE